PRLSSQVLFKNRFQSRLSEILKQNPVAGTSNRVTNFDVMLYPGQIPGISQCSPFFSIQVLEPSIFVNYPTPFQDGKFFQCLYSAVAGQLCLWVSIGFHQLAIAAILTLAFYGATLNIHTQM